MIDSARNAGCCLSSRTVRVRVPIAEGIPMNDSDTMKVGAESVRVPKKVYGADGEQWAKDFKADPMRTAPGGAGALVVEWYEGQLTQTRSDLDKATRRWAQLLVQRETVPIAAHEFGIVLAEVNAFRDACGLAMFKTDAELSTY